MSALRVVAQATLSERKERGMSLSSLCQAIELWPFSQAFAVDIFWIPAVETTHLVSLALLVGSITTFDARLLGLGMRHVPVSRLGKRLLPWTWAAFSLNLATGALLFTKTAESLYCFNSAFRIKMLLILLAGVNMAVFHLTVYRSVSKWDNSHPTPLQAKLAGSFSILLWLCVVIAARWIPFV